MRENGREDGEDMMLNVLKNLGYSDPYAKLNELLEQLYRRGEFLYVTVPRGVEQPDPPRTEDDEVFLAEFRLSRN